MLWVLLLLLGVGVVAAVVVGDSGSLGGVDGAMIAGIVASLALLIFIGLPALRQYRGQLPKAVSDLLIWVAIMLALVLGYAFRHDFQYIYQRMAGELMPPGHTLSVSDETGQHAVRIRRQPNGQFTARAEVNGATVSMLVDTGASTIVLTSSDASAAGIDLARLGYTIPVRTANGTAYAAASSLNAITVGTITMYGVRILIAKPGTLDQSLLGMNFLTRLRSYEFSGEFLTLRG